MRVIVNYEIGYIVDVPCESMAEEAANKLIWDVHNVRGVEACWRFKGLDDWDKNMAEIRKVLNG